MLILPLLAATMAAPATPVDAANAQDVACIALFAAAAGNSTDKDQAGTIAAFMYYLGRIDARAPGYDLEGHLVALLSDEAYLKDQLPKDGERCGKELSQRGSELDKIGKAMSAIGQPAK
ncbi:hypothetical protein [Novosphingobium lentum]|uniref:hypothetical protein n=1 Tax=Novosphingobium lentum TaxID=145287 RepID=UPI000837A47C|nr:hypothetical protein [Novosphingobium lentum]